jgi:lipoprotein-anchoring transpeptidase ErfK/SrfK
MHWKWRTGSVLVLLSLLWWLPAKPVFAQETEHEVLRGESLSEIAADHGTDVATLQRFNDLDDVHVIWVGMVLQLPPKDDLTRESAPEPELLISNPVVQTTRETSNQFVLDSATEGDIFLDAPIFDAIDITNDTLDNFATESEIIHTVVRGEHLGTVSKQYGVSAAAIAEANDLEDANIIVPGQQLVIPMIDETVQARSTDWSADTNDSSATLAESYHMHTELPSGLTEPTEKWIDVDLSEQRVVAYIGLEAVQTFVVSTGLPGTPTVQGEFRIWAKTPLQDMYGGNRAAGDYYYLEDVAWVQYFYEDYAFHGATWHNNFGQPMSRGCVNMRVEDAKWLFEWATPSMDLDASGWLFTGAEESGTLVVVHE